MQQGKHWTDEQRSAVQQLISRGLPTEEICRNLGVTKNSVRYEKWRLTPKDKKAAIAAYTKGR